MVRDKCLWPGPGGVDPGDTTRASDVLAFAFILFFTRKLKVPGFKVRRILDVIAEDATRYFLVIFGSHFVFVMTLNLGRVSATISHSGSPTVMFTGWSCSQRLNFFQPRKPSPTHLERNNPDHTFFIAISGLIVYVLRLTYILLFKLLTPVSGIFPL